MKILGLGLAAAFSNSALGTVVQRAVGKPAISTCDPGSNPDRFLNEVPDERDGVFSFSFGEADDPESRFDPYHVDLIAPSNCSFGLDLEQRTTGCPVLIFQGATVNAALFAGGIIETTRYYHLFRHLAANGLAVVALDGDGIRNPNPENFRDDLGPVFDFVLSGELQTEINAEFGFGLELDVDQVFVGGHGNGVRAILERLLVNEECSQGRIAGIVMVDPTEQPPQNTLNEFDPIIPISAQQNLPWDMPALHFQSERSGLAAGVNAPCAPVETSNSHFTERWRGPLIRNVAQKYAHVDICNTEISFNEKDNCKTTSTDVDNPAAKTCYRQGVAAHILNFVNFFLNGEEASSLFLSPQGTFEISAEINDVFYNREALNIATKQNRAFEDVPGYCIIDPDGLDPLTRNVLKGVGAFAGFLLIVIIYYVTISSRRTKKDEEEIQALAVKMRSKNIVPGMGYVDESSVAGDEVDTTEHYLTNSSPPTNAAPSVIDPFPQRRVKSQNQAVDAMTAFPDEVDKSGLPPTRRNEVLSEFPTRDEVNGVDDGASELPARPDVAPSVHPGYDPEF